MDKSKRTPYFNRYFQTTTPRSIYSVVEGSQYRPCQNLSTTCQYKHVFEMEFYVTALDAEKTIKHIASIRLGSHNLEIETGRFNNVIRAQRICKLCNMNCVESEYHFLCICPAYSSLRRQYIHVSWPTLDKYYRLLSTKSNDCYINLANMLI